METQAVLAAFEEIALRRGWAPLHTPKNLAMALSVEVAELCRHLQWRGDDDIRQLMEGPAAAEVAAELADVQMYLLKLAQSLDVDMDAALRDKIAENRARCAVAAGGGSADG